MSWCGDIIGLVEAPKYAMIGLRHSSEDIKPSTIKHISAQPMDELGNVKVYGLKWNFKFWTCGEEYTQLMGEISCSQLGLYRVNFEVRTRIESRL